MRSIGLAPSALRFGLVDLQPFEETIEEKFGNVKFIVKQLRLRPSESFRDYSTLSSIAAIENLTEIPPRFSKDSLRDFITDFFEKSVQQNPDLKKLVEETERGGLSSGGKFELTSLFADFAAKYAKGIDEHVKLEISKFIDSDLPFTVFDQFSLFDRTFAMFLSTLTEASASMQRLVSLSYRARGVPASRHQLDEFKRKIRSVLSASDVTWVSSFSLRLYLELTHSTSLDELFKPKQFRLENLEKNEFDRLLRELTMNNLRFRQQLIQYGPRGEMPEFEVKGPVYSVWREMNEQLTQA